jgi:predicted helicase
VLTNTPRTSPATQGAGSNYTNLASEPLADLHINFDKAEPYPLDVQLKPGTDPDDRETWRVDKMRWRSKRDKSAILYNGRITLAGIPDAAHGYLLGSRTALEWIIERYQAKTDRASGIVNDPNAWCDEQGDPTYVIELIKKVTAISVTTVDLIGQLSRIRTPSLQQLNASELLANRPAAT